MCLSLEQSVGTSAANAIVDLFGTPVTENERGWLDEICDASFIWRIKTDLGACSASLAAWGLQRLRRRLKSGA